MFKQLCHLLPSIVSFIRFVLEERAGCFALFVCMVSRNCHKLCGPRVCLQFVIVVFPDHTHLLFLLFTCLSYFIRRVLIERSNC